MHLVGWKLWTARIVAIAGGAILLFAYSLGLMLPFIGAGVFSGWTRSLMNRLISTLANYVPVSL